MLGIPTVLGQLIQQALLQVLTPVFDPTFSEDSPFLLHFYPYWRMLIYALTRTGHLAKVGVAGSSPVSRSRIKSMGYG